MTLQQFLDELSHTLRPIIGHIDPILATRFLIVTVLCGLIGFERSGHEKASGFRQHILVGIGACLMAMAGGYGFPDIAGVRDPMRVASYVVSGIGFLGAGAILRHGTTVSGMTTAASIWCAAGIGIATGVGLGGLAALSTLLILFTLVTLQRLEDWFQSRSSTNGFDVHLRNDDRAVGKALGALTRLGVPIKRATLLPGEGESSVLHIELSQPMKKANIRRMVENLLTLKVVERVDTQEIRSIASSVDDQEQVAYDPMQPRQDEEREVDS